MKISFTKREDELMHFLWAAGEPVTVGEIVDIDRAHHWRETYVRVLLRSLERKGAVKCCEELKHGERYARQFCPCMTKEEYYAQLMANDGSNSEALLEVAAAAFSKDKNDNPDEVIRKLEQILQDFKAKNERDKE